MGTYKVEAGLLALGIVLGGLFVKKGLDSVSERNRTVTVKGLAEMEVKADLVTWPLVYTELGNDLTTLYERINSTNRTITRFLTEKGLTQEEISINAPELIDTEADRYNAVQQPYRYKATTVITVTSRQVARVNRLIAEQGELLKQGVAILSGDYRSGVTYAYTGLNDIKPQMIEEATKNAREAAEKFAKDSGSKLGGIKRANQGQFSIENRDAYTPYIKKVRVVSTIDYTLED